MRSRFEPNRVPWPVSSVEERPPPPPPTASQAHWPIGPTRVLWTSSTMSGSPRRHSLDKMGTSDYTTFAFATI